MSHFFIDRPIFASVLSIVLTLAGALAFFKLPMAQYPQIAPPTIQVSVTYPGANAEVIAQTVAAPIEQQMNGVEDMLYMSSQSTNAGNYTLMITFRLGVSLNIAQVRVQTRLQLAMPLLPDVVQRVGLFVRKRSPDIIMAVTLTSPDGRYDQLYLSNYATLHIKEQLARLEGVGDIFIFGQRDYSMRIWLDPEKLAARSMTAIDVRNALSEQNRQVASGRIGQPQIGSSPVENQYSTRAEGLLAETDEFDDIIVKTGANGEIVRLKDVGRSELGAANQDVLLNVDGHPAVGIAVFQNPASNVLETADAVYAKMKELSKDFPDGLIYTIPVDWTPFIRESIHEVENALRDSVLLVALVLLLFLQSWRAALIPLIAVPVAIVGTFAVMAAVGISLNNLSLFGLVLAIGIVVDDAIVVVENVERWLEHGLAPRDAARKAMDEVTGPVIAVGLVLCAVFVPCAFISGITGQFFRQFAITIAASTIISCFNSLTLSPALAALLLRPPTAARDPFQRTLDLLLGWIFKPFNALFAFSTRGYTAVVGKMLRVSALVLLLYAGLLGLTWWSLKTLPKGFIPQQDKGRVMVNIQLPDAASTERTTAVLMQAIDVALKTPGVAHAFAVGGNSLLLNATCSNFGTLFVVLKPFDERHDPQLSADAMIAKLRTRFRDEIKDAEIQVFGAAPVDGIGNASGFKLQIEDRGDQGFAALQAEADAVTAVARKDPRLVGLIATYRANTPQLVVDVDRTKCKALGLPLSDVFGTLQMYLGGYSVNEFVRFGRTWFVNVQAEARFRERSEDVGKLQVRNATGDMVPLASVTRIRDVSGPFYIQRYNMYPTATVMGGPTVDASSGDAIDIMQAACRDALGTHTSYEWTELYYLQILAGNTGMVIFGLAVVFVFLTLAAQYESWTLPLSVVLVVPMCLLCSCAGVAIAKQDINIFTQIGFVVLIGLASKNAILIVEFAKQQRKNGATGRDATLEACRLRLRPIMMTSFAFILGVLPLMLAHGAGSEMRRTLGTAVFYGMLGVTFFGILLTPVFFFVVDKLTSRKEQAAESLPKPETHVGS